MTEVLRLAEHHSIVADSDRSEAPLRVLKSGETFAVFDQHGDIVPSEAGEQGLYHDGTRFLSRFELTLVGKRPLLLSSSVSDDNTVFTIDLTNPDIRLDDTIVVPRGQIHVFRCLVLCEACCHMRVRVSNYALHPIEVPIGIRLDADFADVFEVRGTRRARRGTKRPPEITSETALLAYRGLDNRERRACIRWSGHADVVTDDGARFVLSLTPGNTVTLDMSVLCELEPAHDSLPPTVVGFDEAFVATTADANAWRASGCRIASGSESFNRWMARSESDLHMMITRTPEGPYPYAGVPWFSTPFGRDGIITAMEMLWAQPEVARGVLSFLAETQATRVSDAQDAQPGKILHEMRRGEMAALGEVPFERYYGSIDATPLFLMLAAAYYERTADLAFVDRIWPNVLAAVTWMENHGDMDGDGFLEYARRSSNGLVQQGWKDSHDSVFHADGAFAEAPIALCEVQAYAYGAWAGVARLARVRGEAAPADRWQLRGDDLREQFDRAFWCDDLGTYALALDDAKRPCRVRTSNAGHALFTGIAKPNRARRVADALMSETSFAGWGVRTVDATERRYNPMAYHNGSIWPHDNAIVAAGLARYGFRADAARIFGAMFALSDAVDLHRLPELICGFHRRHAERPTLYPVACAPQAWAAGAVYLLLDACLGLSIDAGSRRLAFDRPLLPDGIDSLQLLNLRLGEGSVDLSLDRRGSGVEVTVARREGDVDVSGT